MIATQIMDTVMAAIGHFILLHTIYKFLWPKKSAKYLQYLLPILFSFYFYLIAYSQTFIKIIPNNSIRQIFIPIGIFLLFGVYIALCFKSDIKHKIIAFFGSVLAMFGAEFTIVFIILPFGITADTARLLPFEIKLLIDLAVLFLYTMYSIAVYFIFKNYNLHFPWKITLNVGFIITSCIILFLLIINVTSANLEYLKIAVILSLLCIFVLILSLVSITKYINTQQIEKEDLYWKHQLHDLNIKYSQTYDEKAGEIRQIQHDFKDSLELIRLLLNENTRESQDKASMLINELSQKVDNSKIEYYSNCVTINAILTSKINQAKKDNIIINPSISIPESIRINHNIKDLDLDVILINLLNNAIESCRKIPNPNIRVIDVKITVKGNFLFIKVTNPFTSLSRTNTNKLATTKEDKANHGLGMDIIKNIVETYGGTQTITTKDYQFVHIISLDLNYNSSN